MDRDQLLQIPFPKVCTNHLDENVIIVLCSHLFIHLSNITFKIREYIVLVTHERKYFTKNDFVVYSNKIGNVFINNHKIDLCTNKKEGIQKMSEKCKIGIIGAGRIGRLHTENISRMVADIEIIGIADVNMNVETRLWAEGLGISLVTKDAMDLIGNPDIKAVIICSSTSTHADYIMAAARAGKHIFCEKPIDLSVQKGLEAIKVAKEHSVRLQLGFNRRFDHNFKQVRQLCKSGQVGDIHIVKITSRDPAPPSAAYVAVSGGIFLDMMIHDFDMARFQAGSEITEVYATGAVLVDPEIGKAGDIDTAIVTLKFANGAIGVIDNSRQAVYGYDQRVEVFGSKGSAQCENDTANSVRLSTIDGVKGEKPLYFFLERYKDAYISEITSFVDSILKDTEVEVSGEDGFEDMVAALAAGKSLKENRPVTIQEMKKELGV